VHEAESAAGSFAMKAAGDFDVAVIDEAAQALEALNSHSGCPLLPALCAQSV
jgi:hypothetical protein